MKLSEVFAVNIASEFSMFELALCATLEVAKVWGKSVNLPKNVYFYLRLNIRQNTDFSAT